MSLDVDAEPVVRRAPDLTRIEPATFRGVDCALLAERYVAYRRHEQDGAKENPDEIRPVALASSENV